MLKRKKTKPNPINKRANKVNKEKNAKETVTDFEKLFGTQMTQFGLEYYPYDLQGVCEKQSNRWIGNGICGSGKDLASKTNKQTKRLKNAKWS